MTDEMECGDDAGAYRWPRALTDMIAVIEADYRSAGEAAETARRHAFRAVRALARYHGGRQFYLPKGDVLDRALRDRDIWERFSGRNIPELCRTYQLTEVQIYKILKTQRALALGKHQPDLFTTKTV